MYSPPRATLGYDPGHQELSCEVASEYDRPDGVDCLKCKCHRLGNLQEELEIGLEGSLLDGVRACDYLCEAAWPGGLSEMVSIGGYRYSIPSASSKHSGVPLMRLSPVTHLIFAEC